MATAVMPRMKERYRSEIVPKLMTERGYSNVMEVPRLVKIVVNMGLGEALKDAKLIEGSAKDLATITGQKPQITRARQSIAGFKLREGQSIGAKVTLRGARMWEFLDRLLSLALPRIRDFRGLPTRFDGRGNYTLGLTEQLVFPEVEYDAVYKVHGMDITIVTTAPDDEEAKAFLVALGFPFRDQQRGEQD
jgi:large subunit ribosomal protein L5